MVFFTTKFQLELAPPQQHKKSRKFKKYSISYFGVLVPPTHTSTGNPKLLPDIPNAHNNHHVEHFFFLESSFVRKQLSNLVETVTAGFLEFELVCFFKFLPEFYVGFLFEMLAQQF